MKNILTALLFVLSFIACTKQPLNTPSTANQSIITNAAVAYKDNSISITNFKAHAGSGEIEVTFTTLYEKNIVRLEILKGETANNLCSIYQQDVNANSYSAVKYNTIDVNESNAAALYYMVKYTLANGDWGYTPVFKLSL